MKLIIDISEELYQMCKSCLGDADCIESAIANGIPLDDVKAEIFRQSEQNNENFSHDWNEGFNDGMFHTLTIIGDYFMHIGKAEREDK